MGNVLGTILLLTIPGNYDFCLQKIIVEATMRRGHGPAPDERETRANPGCHLPPPLPSPTVVKDHR